MALYLSINTHEQSPTVVGISEVSCELTTSGYCHSLEKQTLDFQQRSKRLWWVFQNPSFRSVTTITGGQTLHSCTDVYCKKTYAKVKSNLPKGGDSLPSSNPESRSLSLFLCLCPRCLWRLWLFLPPSGTWTPMNNVRWPINKKKSYLLKRGCGKIRILITILSLIINNYNNYCNCNGINHYNINHCNIINYNKDGVEPQIYNFLIQDKIPVWKSTWYNARFRGKKNAWLYVNFD